MTIAQSFLLILIIALVIFGKTSALDTGMIQTMFTAKSPLQLPLESPPTSPSPPPVRVRSGRAGGHKKRVREYIHQRQDSSDIAIPLLSASTNKRGALSQNFFEGPDASPTQSSGLEEENVIPDLVQSSPPTPSGLKSGIKTDLRWISAENLLGSSPPGRWRAPSPLVSQLANGSEDYNEDNAGLNGTEIPDTEDPLLDDEELTEDEGVQKQNQYWPTRPPNVDGTVDSYFL